MAAYTDFFPGTSLDASWNQLTSGNGTITVSDGIVTLAPNGTANGDCAAIWRPVDFTTNFMIEIGIGGTGTGTGLEVSFVIDNNPSLKAYTVADWLFRLINPNDTNPVLRAFPDSGAAFWNNGSWGGTFTTWSDCVTGAGDWYTFIIERDADNGRTRFGLIHKRENTGTYQEDQGFKLLDMTDRYNDSNMSTKGVDVTGIVIGKARNDLSMSADVDLELVYYRESANTRIHAWLNDRTASASGSFNIRKWDAFRDADGAITFYLPEENQPIVTAHKDASVVLESGTYYLTYNDESGNIVQRTASDPYGTWSAPSTLVTLASTGFDSGPGFPHIYKDPNQVASKRWIMLCKYGENTAEPYAEGKLVWFSASAPSGTWTQEGVILVGSNADDWEETGPGGHFLTVYNNQYHVFYQSQNDTTKLNQIGLAKGATLSTLSKSSNNPIITTETNTTTLGAAVSNTNTITVASTANLNAGQLIIIVVGPTDDDYIVVRIRKIVDSTTIETYEAVDTAANGDIVRQIDHFITTPRFVENQGGVWYLYGTKYSGGYVNDAYFESQAIYSCSDADPDSTNWGREYFKSGRPPTLSGDMTTKHSNENIAFVIPELGTIVTAITTSGLLANAVNKLSSGSKVAGGGSLVRQIFSLAEAASKTVGVNAVLSAILDPSSDLSKTIGYGSHLVNTFSSAMNAAKVMNSSFLVSLIGSLQDDLLKEIGVGYILPNIVDANGVSAKTSQQNAILSALSDALVVGNKIIDHAGVLSNTSIGKTVTAKGGVIISNAFLSSVVDGSSDSTKTVPISAVLSHIINGSEISAKTVGTGAELANVLDLGATSTKDIVVNTNMLLQSLVDLKSAASKDATLGAVLQAVLDASNITSKSGIVNTTAKLFNTVTALAEGDKIAISATNIEYTGVGESTASKVSDSVTILIDSPTALAAAAKTVGLPAELVAVLNAQAASNEPVIVVAGSLYTEFRNKHNRVLWRG